MTELTQYVYAFDKANEPIARAKDGDEFSFRTLDCYSGQVCTEEDIVGESFNFLRTNPATGPLYVEGAMPGDVLVVDVLSIEVADKGAVTTIPNIGPLYDRCVDRTRILPVKDGKTELGQSHDRRHGRCSGRGAHCLRLCGKAWRQHGLQEADRRQPGVPARTG